LLSVVISDVAEESFREKDEPRIVIDEWAGIWVTMAFHPTNAATLALGFVLFRIFDVYKLPGVRHAGHLPGGWGVVMDDILAGVLANLCLQLIRYIHPL
jgi:phosphatidylglycerophosphatase A